MSQTNALFPQAQPEQDIPRCCCCSSCCSGGVTQLLHHHHQVSCCRAVSSPPGLQQGACSRGSRSSVHAKQVDR